VALAFDQDARASPVSRNPPSPALDRLATQPREHPFHVTVPGLGPDNAVGYPSA
jgi:hypothetical protein